MSKLFNLVRVTSTSTGSSNIVLNAPVSGFIGFSAAGVTSGDTISYGISDSSQSEVGTAVWNSSIGTGGLLTSRSATMSTAGASTPISLSGSTSIQLIITERSQDVANQNETNTFTVQQVFFSTAASFNPIYLESDSTDAGAGPIVYYDRGMTPADGQYLAKWHFSGRTAGSSFISYAQMTAKVISASSSSPDGAFVFSTLSSGTETERFYLAQGLYGSTMADKGDGTFNSKGFYLNGSSLPTLAGTTYTPTVTAVTNISSAPTATTLQYMRVGTTVTVSGGCTVDPTAASSTLTELGVSLPIASAFTVVTDLGGSGGSTTAIPEPLTIIADTTNDRAAVRWNCQSLTAHAVYFNFTYTIK